MPPGLRAFTQTLAIAILSAATPYSTSASTIGIYTDPSGSSCSFSGNDPGMVTAYVVVKPDAGGIRNVQFAAVAPPCLGATHLYDIVPEGVSSIGSSPTGIAISYAFCASEPALALTVNYFRAGSTTPCCEFPIAAAPPAGEIEGIDCSFNAASVVPTTSRFNADENCPCAEGPPHPPSSPSPADGAIDVSLTTLLTWESSELDEVESYDVYFGTSPVPGLAGTPTQPSFQPQQALQLDTQYYWRVVVHNVQGFETSGPTWTFTTFDNDPPSTPVLLYPANQAEYVLVNNVVLSWSATDPDDDPLTYDLYFSTNSNPGLLAAGLSQTQYALSPLEYNTTYWWKVVVRDTYGYVVSSTIRSFRTKYTNSPPEDPTPEYPLDLAADLPATVTLQWSSSDSDLDSLTYDVHFTAEPFGFPPAIATGLTAIEYSLPVLELNTTYRWKILVHDSFGNTTIGATWRFTTVSAPTGANAIPIELTLGRNHPNPFNPQTIIPYGVPNSGAPVRVRLAIYDAAGRLVRVLVDEEQSGGSRDVLWRGDDSSGRPVTSGVYFCVLDSRGERRTQKLVLLK